MTQTPSSGQSATPNPGTPATGNATGSATPPAAALTLEDALKKIAELEQHAQNKTEEASRHGTRLSAAEKELAAYKAAEEQARQAQMSELEKAQKQIADAAEREELMAAQLHDALVYQDVARLASKFNFVVSVDTLADMLLLRDERRADSTIEFEDGKPANIEKLLEKLAKAEPDLVKKEAQQNQQSQQAPNIPAMSPGRSSIQPPSGNIPGRIPRITDPGMWKTN